MVVLRSFLGRSPRLHFGPRDRSVRCFWPSAQLACPRFALKTQVYALVADRTRADECLDGLVKGGQLLAIQLQTRSRPGGDILYASVDEVLSEVAGEDPGIAELLRVASVACRGRGAFPRQRLATLLRKHVALRGKYRRSGTEDADRAIDVLLQAGWLARHPEDAGVYRLALPRGGAVVKSIDAGRKVRRMRKERALRERDRIELATRAGRLQLQVCWTVGVTTSVGKAGVNLSLGGQAACARGACELYFGN